MTDVGITKDENIVPESMTIKDRNQRLFETLKRMGLYVVPVPKEDDQTVIDYIIVSSVAPGVRLDYLSSF